LAQSPLAVSSVRLGTNAVPLQSPHTISVRVTRGIAVGEIGSSFGFSSNDGFNQDLSD
jgi:hypothetical protein